MVELTAHSRVADKSAVGFLHHGYRFSGAVKRDAGDVRAGGGGSDDVDVAVGCARDQRVGRGGDFAGGSQVVDRLDAQAVQGRQVGPGRRQRIGAIEHAGAQGAVVGRGISTGGAGNVTEVVDALQARSIELVGFGSLGGRDGKA
ncbi:hypothetical protein D3C86_1711460 [compost metagenome]